MDSMADGKDSLKKIEFANWSPYGISIDYEASSDSITNKSSPNEMTKRGSFVYRMLKDKVTFIRNTAAKISKVRMQQAAR